MGNKLKDIRPNLKQGFIGNFKDKDRFIKFDLNAFAEMENLYGDMELAQDRLNEGKIKDIRRMLWIGIIHDEVILNDMGEPISYNITPYEVGSWITPKNMKDIMLKLQETLQASLPEVEVEKNLISDESKSSIQKIKIDLENADLDPNV